MEQNLTYNFKFITYKNDNDAVKFIIKLTCNENPNITFEFFERYKNLRVLHENLKKEVGNNINNYPKFPPKSFFGSPDLEKRRLDLQHFFDSICSQKSLRSLPSFKKFINDLTNRYLTKQNSDFKHNVAGSNQQINSDNSVKEIKTIDSKSQNKSAVQINEKPEIINQSIYKKKNFIYFILFMF